MARRLVRVELSFATDEDPDQLADRIRESVGMIIGPERVEDFRVRSMPMDPKKRDHLRPVD